MGTAEPFALDTTRFLESYIVESTKVRLTKHCRGLPFEVEPADSGPPPSHYGEEMSIIMLWGAMGSFVLKAHFDPPTAAALAAYGLEKDPAEVTPELARDFIREFSNVQGGYLRGVFEDNRLLLGMSLPFLANGRDEEIFSKIRDPRASFARWALREGDRRLVFTAELCLLDPRSIQAIRPALEKDLEKHRAPENAASDGDVEFI